MKRGKDIRAKAEALTADQEAAFIAKGTATKADRLPRADRRQRRTTGRGKMAAKGFRRTSVDLPEDLYRQLKVAAAEEDRTLQSISEEAFTAWLAQRS